MRAAAPSSAYSSMDIYGDFADDSTVPFSSFALAAPLGSPKTPPASRPVGGRTTKAEADEQNQMDEDGSRGGSRTRQSSIAPTFSHFSPAHSVDGAPLLRGQSPNAVDDTMESLNGFVLRQAGSFPKAATVESMERSMIGIDQLPLNLPSSNQNLTTTMTTTTTTAPTDTASGDEAPSPPLAALNSSWPLSALSFGALSDDDLPCDAISYFDFAAETGKSPNERHGQPQTQSQTPQQHQKLSPTYSPSKALLLGAVSPSPPSSTSARRRRGVDAGSQSSQSIALHIPLSSFQSNFGEYYLQMINEGEAEPLKSSNPTAADGEKEDQHYIIYPDGLHSTLSDGQKRSTTTSSLSPAAVTLVEIRAARKNSQPKPTSQLSRQSSAHTDPGCSAEPATPEPALEESQQKSESEPQLHRCPTQPQLQLQRCPTQPQLQLRRQKQLPASPCSPVTTANSTATVATVATVSSALAQQKKCTSPPRQRAKHFPVKRTKVILEEAPECEAASLPSSPLSSPRSDGATRKVKMPAVGKRPPRPVHQHDSSSSSQPSVTTEVHSNSSITMSPSDRTREKLSITRPSKKLPPPFVLESTFSSAEKTAGDLSSSSNSSCNTPSLHCHSKGDSVTLPPVSPKRDRAAAAPAATTSKRSMSRSMGKIDMAKAPEVEQPASALPTKRNTPAKARAGRPASTSSSSLSATASIPRRMPRRSEAIYSTPTLAAQLTSPLVNLASGRVWKDVPAPPGPTAKPVIAPHDEAASPYERKRHLTPTYNYAVPQQPRQFDHWGAIQQSSHAWQPTSILESSGTLRSRNSTSILPSRMPFSASHRVSCVVLNSPSSIEPPTTPTPSLLRQNGASWKDTAPVPILRRRLEKKTTPPAEHGNFTLRSGGIDGVVLPSSARKN